MVRIWAGVESVQREVAGFDRRGLHHASADMASMLKAINGTLNVV